MSDDYNAKDYNDIHRIIKQLREEWWTAMTANIEQMKAAVIKWEQVQHYQDERLRANKEEKAFRTKMNMMENNEYFRQIRRNMNIRHAHTQFGETMSMVTKSIFGGGIGLGTAFSTLTKGVMSVMASQREEQDIRDDIANNLREEMTSEKGSAQHAKFRGARSEAEEELKRLLESPQSQLGKLKIFGKTISERLSGAGEFFRKNKTGIILSIGSIGLLVTALKLVYNTSPMMQASVKLLKLIWNLGLRPIGDFFGFIMRPIFIMFLRSFILPWYKVAYPFYQKWGNKIGDLMSNFTLQGFADLMWEWFDKADVEMKIFTTALATAAGGLGLGGFYIALKGLIAFINLITGKTPTPTGSATPAGTTVKTPQPALPAPKTVGAGISTFPEHLKPFSTLYNKPQPALPAPKATTNIGMSPNIKKWISKQWGHIKMAGDRMGKTFQQMGAQFWKTISKHPVLSRFFTPDKLKGVMGGGIKGVAGMIPAIVGNIMEAIDPVQWGKDTERLYKEFPFFDPEFGGGGAVGQEAMAEGGIIREPISGIGRSGKMYSFGERGAEMVTPMGGGVGGTSITINIQNMSGSQQDLNNLRATILAVIQEANTRSGRI